MSGYAILVLVMLIPAVLGGKLARNRGRNIAVWALLSALFPIFIMVIYFEKPVREVAGGFKRCPSCNEYNPWKAAQCKYCSTAFPSHPTGK